jgi:RNAse (barnase) inhibitor barstar
MVNSISQSDSETYIGTIDGVNCLDIPSFLKEISSAFKFPDYFGYNYNALDECLNDLEIDFPNYILYIKNYSYFLEREDHEVRIDTLKLFQNACAEWANVPNFEGEEEFRKKANFKIYIERCEAIETDLKKLPLA